MTAPRSSERHLPAPTHLVLFAPPRRSRPQWSWSGAQAAELDYVRLDSEDHAIDSGRCRIDQLPAHRQCTLVLAASDVLVVHCRLPPLQGSRLSQALPGLLEDYLLQDTEQSSFALDPAEQGLEQRHVAVVDKTWLQALQQAVTAGRRRPVAVTAAHWLHQDGLAATGARTVIRSLPAAPDAQACDPTLELWLHDGRQVQGLLLSNDDLDSSLEWLDSLHGRPGRLHWLVEEEQTPLPAALLARPALAGFTALPLAELARRAWRHPLAISTGSGFRQLSARRLALQDLRPALGWMAAALACALLGSTFDAWRMQHQVEQWRSTMLVVLHSALPDLKVVLDPARQLHQAYLARLGHGDGERSDHFLALADATARALDDTDRRALTRLDFDEHGLQLEFAPQTSPQRIQSQLQAAGLQVHHHDGQLRWTVENTHAD